MIRNFSFVKRNANTKKALVLASVVVLFVALFIPIWNYGVERGIEMQAERGDRRVAELDIEERAERARLSELHTKEQIETYLVAYNVAR